MRGGIGPQRRCARSREPRGHARGMPQRDEDVVVATASPGGDLGVHALGTSMQRQRRVDEVDAEVEQRPTTLRWRQLLPPRARRQLGAPAIKARLLAEDGAERTIGEQPLHGEVIGVPAPVGKRHEDHAPRGGELAGVPCLRRGGSDGLLGHDMLAGVVTTADDAVCGSIAGLPPSPSRWTLCALSSSLSQADRAMASTAESAGSWPSSGRSRRGGSPPRSRSACTWPDRAQGCVSLRRWCSELGWVSSSASP